LHAIYYSPRCPDIAINGGYLIITDRRACREEILEGIKQLKKTLDATSSSAYNEFLLQCLQVFSDQL
jgi:hypothetical protein